MSHSNALEPFEGNLGPRRARHILNRATYHPTWEKVNFYRNKTASETIDELFDYNPINHPQLHPHHPIGTDGQRIVRVDINPINNPNNGYTPNIRTWMMFHSIKSFSIEWKLINFLHTLYPVELGVIDKQWAYDYIRIIKKYSKGSIKQFAKEASLSCAMLEYLNIHGSRPPQPDENFAREFLELFSIRKGNQVGPDDYTTYTEQDVRELAKIMTGFVFTARSHNSPQLPERLTTTLGSNLGFDPPFLPTAKVQAFVHWNESIQFSNRLQNYSIPNPATTENGVREEFFHFVDHIYDRVRTARQVVVRLYRFFVGRVVNPYVRENIIGPLADDLLNQDYNIEFVVKKLLCSKHFFDEDDDQRWDNLYGGMVKSPADLLFGLINQLRIDIPTPDSGPSPANNINRAQYTFTLLNKFQNELLAPSAQSYFSPFTVEGYSGYKQPPWDRNWINSTTMVNRLEYPVKLTQNYWIHGHLRFINLAEFVKDNSDLFPNPANSNVLVNHFLRHFLGFNVYGNGVQSVKNHYREALMGGLSPTDWEINWNHYISSGYELEVRPRLEALYKSIVSSIAYQVM